MPKGLLHLLRRMQQLHLLPQERCLPLGSQLHAACCAASLSAPVQQAHTGVPTSALPAHMHLPQECRRSNCPLVPSPFPLQGILMQSGC